MSAPIYVRDWGHAYYIPHVDTTESETLAGIYHTVY